MGDRDDPEQPSWLDAMRRELERYQENHDESIVTLRDVYEFSEDRLSARFPNNNNNVRAKIRQQLQDLRNENEVEFLEQGRYRLAAGEDVQRAKMEIKRELGSEPELTDDEAEFTESERRVRSRAFVELVKEAYDRTCAFCGSSRETPTGNPEVEAAHIYPKEQRGADDVRNGIALCKLHHWAFDTGWLALTNEHTIPVKEAPDRDGYGEFKQLAGESMRQPNRESAAPARVYLEAHRELNEF